MVIFAGTPGNWREVRRHETLKYMSWTRLPLDVTTRYLRIERSQAELHFLRDRVVRVYGRRAPGNAHAESREEKEKAARDAAMTRAEEEAKNRPLVDMGPLFGKLILVDEVDCSRPPDPGSFREDPPAPAGSRPSWGGRVAS